MRKDQRNLVLSIALAGTVIASIAAPVAAAEANPFFKFNISNVLISGAAQPVAAVDAFHKFDAFYKI